jgi:DNA-binding transcriptional LysR family regulator
MQEPARHYFKELRLQQFRGLLALSRHQTFSAAANSLKLTRASVWQQVRALEKELACTLLRTREHRVELTSAGRKLVEMIAPLVTGFDSIKPAFAAAHNALPKTLAIATAPSFIVYELHEPISRFHTLYPKLHLTFLERNSPGAIELLDQGGADLAVASRPDNVSMKSSLEYTPLTTYSFTLICPPKHPLLTKKKLTLNDFTRHPLILASNATYCRRHFDAVMSRAGIMEKTNVVLESNFPVMHFEYVRLGMGVALSPLPPASALKQQLLQSGMVLRDVADLFGEEPVYYVRRKGEFETPYAAKFREMVMAQCNKK